MQCGSEWVGENSGLEGHGGCDWVVAWPWCASPAGVGEGACWFLVE